ncbi:DUF2569 domain-containing protein [Acinetobacter sp. YH12145]|uniref:DUF2569 domain-containing protein n=1 Tax=Acinetobacter sp. YH12145 TaxID=2601129 RepID=UPI0015D42FA9|nr:DUF2569 domain-containing protein [Acinetobacter sp. YH12145]
MNNQRNLKGLGGWLIVLGIKIVLSLLLLSFDIYSLYQLFQNEALSQISDQKSELYYPTLMYLLYIESILNIVFFLLSVCAVYLFFSKHLYFPTFYIAFMASFLLVQLCDSAILSVLFTDKNALDTETIMQLATSTMGCLIWTPYLLMSVRVKNTFTQHSKHSA